MSCERGSHLRGADMCERAIGMIVFTRMTERMMSFGMAQGEAQVTTRGLASS